MKDLAERLRLLYICGGREDEIARLAALIDGGVTAVQLRMKDATGRELYERALAAGRICRDGGALFFVNDRLDVALACGADGAHFGADDLPIPAARGCAPPPFLIGATARTPQAARRAERDGADYVGCGAAFPSATKGDTTRIGQAGIAAVTRAVRIPAVAIGGITAENMGQLANAGICGVAAAAALDARDKDLSEARDRAIHMRETLRNWRESAPQSRRK